MDDQPMFTDPAVIAAMGVCWLFQTNNAGTVIIARQVMDRHGEACAWCDYLPETLMDYIEDFWHWVRDADTRAVRDWDRLPPSEQHRRVMTALSPVT